MNLCYLMIYASGIIILNLVFMIVILCLCFSLPFKFFLFPASYRIYRIIKFGFINTTKDLKGNLLSYSERFTLSCLLIRKTCLREIIQLDTLLQCFTGFINPKLLRTKYLRVYNEKQNRLHLVRPDFTEEIQVRGLSNNKIWT